MVPNDIPAVGVDVTAALRRLIAEQSDVFGRRRDIAANRCHVTAPPDAVQPSIGAVVERDHVLTTCRNDLASACDDLTSTFNDLTSIPDDLLLSRRDLSAVKCGVTW